MNERHQKALFYLLVWLPIKWLFILTWRIFKFTGTWLPLFVAWVGIGLRVEETPLFGFILLSCLLFSIIWTVRNITRYFNKTNRGRPETTTAPKMEQSSGFFFGHEEQPPWQR